MDHVFVPEEKICVHSAQYVHYLLTDCAGEHILGHSQAKQNFCSYSKLQLKEKAAICVIHLKLCIL